MSLGKSHPGATDDPISRERRLRRLAKRKGLRLIAISTGYVLIPEAGVLDLEQAEKIVAGWVQ